jgi:hypothetical protein
MLSWLFASIFHTPVGCACQHSRPLERNLSPSVEADGLMTQHHIPRVFRQIVKRIEYVVIPVRKVPQTAFVFGLDSNNLC